MIKYVLNYFEGDAPEVAAKSQGVQIDLCDEFVPMYGEVLETVDDAVFAIEEKYGDSPFLYYAVITFLEGIEEDWEGVQVAVAKYLS